MKTIAYTIVICIIQFSVARAQEIPESAKKLLQKNYSTIEQTPAANNAKEFQPPVKKPQQGGQTGNENKHLQLYNATNGDIPFRVVYAEPRHNYESDITSGSTEVIFPDEDCQLQIPDGKYTLTKGNHYQLYLDISSKKIRVQQVP